jgi:hypothetical protein
MEVVNMSTLASVQMISPANKSEECARFTIADTREEFTFTNVATVGEEYTLSFWIKSEAPGNLIVNGNPISTDTTWQRYVFTYITESEDLVIDFEAAGTYYIYHLQLEIGGMATDWTVAVEDVDEGINNAQYTADNAQSTANNAVERVTDAEALIQLLQDSIRMLVRDENGESLMVQEGNGWLFSMETYTRTLKDVSTGLLTLTDAFGDTKLTVDSLNTAMMELTPTKPWIRIGEYYGSPCIELGREDSEFRLRITNTEIQFIDGTIVPAYLSNQKLYIEKAEVTDELQFGGFIWKKRSNGNMGLMWIGGSS